ncbi:hypothetical protein SAMN04515656_11227 [Eubacterium aggregans]|uniref:Uncharacterized protein n=1 Tax=Eubacterium aggregans TaxID=81409 RepID=A0A1H4BPJ4_9FIRM|nr:hypothetical protein [Eubacterium aggregans]SEA50075.1 hypothetical protein SAMN04515656_11227 [Eubacterium aggregans]
MSDTILNGLLDRLQANGAELEAMRSKAEYEHEAHEATKEKLSDAHRMQDILVEEIKGLTAEMEVAQANARGMDPSDECPQMESSECWERKAEDMAIKMVEMETENRDLKREVERLKKGGNCKGEPKGKPAVMNQSFEDAVEIMERKSRDKHGPSVVIRPQGEKGENPKTNTNVDDMKVEVLPDTRIDNTPIETDRFEPIIEAMRADENGKGYRYERKGATIIVFRRARMREIMVKMPGIKSVPQWSVKGVPVTGMAEALQKSRSRGTDNV